MIDNELKLPENWEWVSLKEISKILSGFAFKSTDFISKGTPVIKISNIGYSEFLWKEQQFVPQNFKNDFKNFVINSGDLLIALTRPITNNTTKVCKYPANTESGVLNQRVASIKDITGNKEYLFWYFQTDEFKNYLRSKFSETLQPNLSPKDLALTPIPLPPLFEQQEIVAKIEELLSELDQGKQQLETARQQLKVYRQAVLKWAFEGNLTNAIQNRQKTQESELPVGWKSVKLNDICNIIGGVTKGRDFKGKETIMLPYLRVANVQDGYLDLKEIKEIEVLPSDREKYKLKFGDILYTEGGDKDKLGRGTIWKDEIVDCIHQNHIFRARPISPEINSKFVAYFSQTKTAKNYFLKHGKQTTNLASINLTVLKNLPLSLPPVEEQNQIVQEIESRLSVCDKVEETITQSLQQAETLRQSILKQAFEGKLVMAGKTVAEMA